MRELREGLDRDHRPGGASPVGVSAFGIEPGKYRPHPLHGDDRLWTEKNCYVDLWIEVLHARSFDPVVVLPFVVAVAFDGDQWTFFKPPHGDLYEVYGIDVEELCVWRPLLEHALVHLGAGNLVLTETDAFHLPDTHGTDYRQRHVKTAIAIETIDIERKVLGYFHNGSYYVLNDADFDGVFRPKVADDATLPLYAEIARFDRTRQRLPGELLQLSLGLLRRHLARRPKVNPFIPFRVRFQEDLKGLQVQGLPTYHAYAFANMRQFGASFELAAVYLQWLAEQGETGLGAAAAAFENISNAAKVLVLKAARAVSAKKAVDFGATFEEMAAAWDRAMGVLQSRYLK